MINFRVKEFSMVTDIATGAKLGGTLGGIAGGIYFRSKKEFIDSGKKNDDGKPIQYEVNKSRDLPWFRGKSIKVNQTEGTAIGAATGIVCGAALGALVGVTKKVIDKINHKNTVNNRMMKEVLRYLTSYTEGVDFTRDPKVATDLGTKICIVLSKESGQQRIVINTKAEPKLKTVTDKIVQELSGKNISYTDTYSDKFNDIVISLIPDTMTAKMIADIIKKFMDSNYPVYLVEVG